MCYCSNQDFALAAKFVRMRKFSQEGIQTFAAGELPMV